MLEEPPAFHGAAQAGLRAAGLWIALEFAIPLVLGGGILLVTGLLPGHPQPLRQVFSIGLKLEHPSGLREPATTFSAGWLLAAGSMAGPTESQRGKQDVRSTSSCRHDGLAAGHRPFVDPVARGMSEGRETLTVESQTVREGQSCPEPS